MGAHELFERAGSPPEHLWQSRWPWRLRPDTDVRTCVGGYRSRARVAYQITGSSRHAKNARASVVSALTNSDGFARTSSRPLCSNPIREPRRSASRISWVTKIDV